MGRAIYERGVGNAEAEVTGCAGVCGDGRLRRLVFQGWDWEVALLRRLGGCAVAQGWRWSATAKMYKLVFAAGFCLPYASKIIHELAG